MKQISPMVRDIRQCDDLLFREPLPVLIERMKYSRQLERVWSLIADSYADPSLDLKTVTRSCGISRNQFYLLLRRTVSFTFHELLVRYRIRRAVELLWERNYSVTEITFKVGFGSVAAFNRNFRALMRTSPSRFKRESFEIRSMRTELAPSEHL